MPVPALMLSHGWSAASMSAATCTVVVFISACRSGRSRRIRKVRAATLSRCAWLPPGPWW